MADDNSSDSVVIERILETGVDRVWLMPDGHPVTTEVVVELEDLDGRTKMVMTHIGVPPDSPGAVGWNMAFDKLVVRLSETPS